jgi:predicted nucleic acid-binding protein
MGPRRLPTRAGFARRGAVSTRAFDVRYDLLIAGHARARGLIVVTGDLGAFERVDGLRCEDWLA